MLGERYTLERYAALLTYHSIFGNVAPFVFNHLRKFLSSWLEMPDVPSPELLLSWWLISFFSIILNFTYLVVSLSHFLLLHCIIASVPLHSHTHTHPHNPISFVLYCSSTTTPQHHHTNNSLTTTIYFHSSII